MRYFSVKKLMTVVSLVLVSSAITGSTLASNSNTFTFTANGKTSIKTAMLFKRLMTNQPSVRIVQNHPILKQKVNRDVTYTITGKTTKSQVKKFIQLLKSNSKIEVQTNVHRSSQDLAQANNTFKYYPSFYLSHHYFSTNPTHQLWVPQYTNYPSFVPMQLASK